MCGRFAIYSDPPPPLQRLTPRETWEMLTGRYNVAPGTWIAGVRRKGDEAEPSLTRLWWGYRPSWASPDAPQPINARVEKLASSRYFQGAFKHHRCVIPADGWYEWFPQPDGKLPHYLCRADRQMLWLAGIWADYGDGSACCAIISEPARGCARDIHDRMPLVLADDSFNTWLDPELHERDTIRSAVHHLDAQMFTHWAVSTRINRPANDDPSLIEPADAGHQ
ncbi:SOS response-associated peptidase [Halomonas sp. THAF12]|uniref:SOS response-associated peptidase n=1 Tax=Halomonas sp. THAF12 TaxID=2587849 RepID=UPI0012694118|nr:SOS response-associated peptidase [Halomonas sp. THAF12]